MADGQASPQCGSAVIALPWLQSGKLSKSILNFEILSERSERSVVRRTTIKSEIWQS